MMETRQGMFTFIPSTQHCSVGSSQCSRQEEKIKNTDWKELTFSIHRHSDRVQKQSQGVYQKHYKN